MVGTKLYHVSCGLLLCVIPLGQPATLSCPSPIALIRPFGDASRRRPFHVGCTPTDPAMLQTITGPESAVASMSSSASAASSCTRRALAVTRAATTRYPL
eukprot:2535041-Prymnesium_polylepis.1